MKKLVILGVLALALAGCQEKKPIKAVDSGNGDISAQLMAIVEGCKVYRIGLDRWVYTTICPDGRRASSQWTEGCGKNCSYEAFSNTVAKND